MLRVILSALLLAGCGVRTSLPELVQAAREGSAGRIRTLANQGADLNVHAGVNGWTPLMHAIHKNQKGSVVALLEAGANVNERGSGGETPLMMAAGYGYTDIVNVLLDHGADAKMQLKDGKNALTIAVMGVPDIDRFTLADCQVPTALTLARRSPGLRLAGVGNLERELLAAKLKGCVGIDYLLGRSRP